jgi:hypothetical protein
MFPHRYFPNRYFAGEYFPPVVAIAAVIDEGLDPNRFFVGGSIGRSVKDPRVHYVSALKGYFSAVESWPQYQRKKARALARKVQKASFNDSPKDLEQLINDIQALVETLAEAREEALASFSAPLFPDILVQKISDMMAKMQEDEDELITMMLLQ